MTMRRLPKWLPIAVACGALLSLGILTALLRAGPGHDSRALRTLAGFSPRPASAQEAMEFTPVPRESADAQARAGRGSVPAPPAVSAVPAVPALPEPPGGVDVEVSKSGDVVRFGSDIHVRRGQTIVGDVVAMGGDVTVDGHVEGDVVAMGGDVILNSTGSVDGEVVTIGGQLREEPGSHVGGQRVTAGGLPRGWSGWPFLGFLGLVGSGLKAAWAIAKMIVLLLVAWGFTQLAPNRTRVAFDACKREPLMCFGLGLLAWALVIPSVVALALVAAILCITIIGIPLALAVILGYVLVLMLLVVWGYVVGAAVLGERLARQLGRNVSTLTLMAVWGIVALTTIRVVGALFSGLPMGGFAGGLLGFLAAAIGAVLVTIGAGALLRTQARRDVLGSLWSGTWTPPGGSAAPAAAPATGASGAVADAAGEPPAPPPAAGPSPTPGM